MSTTFQNISDDQLDVPVPAKREIVAALASELLAECIRVNALPDWIATCVFGGGADCIEVYIESPYEGYKKVNRFLYLGASDAAERIRGLINIVSAMGEVSE